MTINQRLFAIMERKHISIPELGRMTGISRQTIYDWKKKETNPSADKIMVLCEALEITPEELLVGKSDHEEKEIKVFDDPKTELITDGVTFEIAKGICEMSESQRKRMLAFMSMLLNTDK